MVNLFTGGQRSVFDLKLSLHALWQQSQCALRKKDGQRNGSNEWQNSIHKVQDKPLILQLHFTHHLYFMSESIKLSLKRICTLCSPNLHLTLFCKPYPGFLGDSKMLTITSLLAWLCGCVCVCECKATEWWGKADICSILVGSRFRPSEWLQSFFKGSFFFLWNGRAQNWNVRSKFRVVPVKVKLTWTKNLEAKLVICKFALKCNNVQMASIFWALILPLPTNFLCFERLFPPALFFYFMLNPIFCLLYLHCSSDSFHLQNICGLNFVTGWDCLVWLQSHEAV